MQYLLRDKVNYDYQLKQEFLALLDVNLLCFDVTDAPGAAHLKTADETWVEDFQRLASRARTIVIVPGVSKGIGDEIRWLTQNGLLNTAFFLKPKGYPKHRWNEMVSKWKEKAFLELPVYTRREMSFRLDSNGKCFEECTWPSRLLARGNLRDLEMRRRLFANRPLDGSNDYGLVPFPGGAFSFAWPWSLQWVVFYVFWIGIVSGAFCVAFLAMALENSFESLFTLETAVFWYPFFGGAVCSALAILGIWKGRQYGKWCAVMCLVFELLASAALLIYTGPHEIYQAFKMEPAINTTALVLFGLAPVVMILRLLYSKYVNRFFY
jgi:hypothetical protein